MPGLTPGMTCVLSPAAITPAAGADDARLRFGEVAGAAATPRPPTARPARKSLSARRMSLAVAKRWAGSFSRAVMMMSSRAGSTSGLISRGGTG